MSVRSIRLYGDPILSSPADPIAQIDDNIRGLVADLCDTTREPGRAGVAACQIGVGLRAFSLNVEGVVSYVINPEIVELGGEIAEVEEGCLSVPGFFFPTPRHRYARVRGIDLDGAPIEIEGEGLMAQALQHESDHLEGIVYVRRLVGEHRKAAMSAIRGSDWFRHSH